jgi:molybdate transport system regulatory protein
VTNPTIRLRVDFATLCSVGPGKIALLEAIHRTGSLSQAARELRVSYRRGWQLLWSLNTSFQTPTVVTSTGGRGGGGAQVTPFGKELIRCYRAFERHAEARALRAFKGITEKARRRAPSAHAVPVMRPRRQRGPPRLKARSHSRQRYSEHSR